MEALYERNLPVSGHGGDTGVRRLRFGMKFRALDGDQPVYRFNEQQFFVAASATKLLTEGTALALLGPDYRFHTRVFRSGARVVPGDPLAVIRELAAQVAKAGVRKVAGHVIIDASLFPEGLTRASRMALTR